MYLRRLLILAALAGAAMTIVAVQTGASNSTHTYVPSGGCGVTNAEAIIDDSGSMAGTDSNRLRVSAMDLLIDNSPAGRTLGAIEFGTSADTIFAPEAIGPNAASMKSALDKAVQADNGATDYNLAFQTGRAANPNANGWIFLTDGGHDVGDYQNGHRGLAPIMVVGLGIGKAGTGDPSADRLQQIANETGGQYFPAQDASSLQATLNVIGSIWACQQPPKTFQDQFTHTGQAVSHAVTVPRGVKVANLTTSYSDPNSSFQIAGIQEVRGGHVVAKGLASATDKRKPKIRIRKLRVTRKQGTTYVIVRVSKLVPGKLRFKVRAAKLGNERTVTTQVGRTR